MTDEQHDTTDDTADEAPKSGKFDSSLLAKIRRVESAAGISKPHQGMVFTQAVTVHHITPPPVHRHRWAWAQLVSGGVRRVCYDCGAEA